jgi:hypothetical protein
MNNNMKSLTIAALTASALLIGGASYAELPDHDLPPCEMEDSINCYWDASAMGNGIGNSFIAIGECTEEMDGTFIETLTYEDGEVVTYESYDITCDEVEEVEVAEPAIAIVAEASFTG